LLRLDDRRLWFRYHQLFRDFLLAGLDGQERVALPVRQFGSRITVFRPTRFDM